MAGSVNKNVFGQTTIKLTRGKPVQLGTIVNAGDVVQFTVSGNTADHQYVILQTQGGTTPTLVLEASIDGGTSWFVYANTQTTMFTNVFAITGQPGSDTAATGAFGFLVLGLAGALFRFGRTDNNGGNAIVFGLLG